MKKAAWIVIGVVLAMIGGYAVSHSGGLDQYGCHKDNSNGSYHCHR